MKNILPAALGSRRPPLLLLALTLGLSVLNGCAITGDVFGTSGALKKKVAISVFENRTRSASADLSASFQRQLTDKVTRACSDALPVTPEDKTFPEYLENLPRLPSGLIDNFAVATIGRKYGFNAIVTGALLEIKIDEEASGFWWFQGSRPYVELLAGVEALDTETGAKILDEYFARKSKIRQEEFEALQRNEIDALMALSGLLQEIAGEIAESICFAVNRQAWMGYIISVSPDKVVLSSGGDSGLAAGDELGVYDSSSTFSGHAGQKFFLPGPKIGEIRITGVYPSRSEAVVISGTDIREGCSVKYR